MRNHSREWSRQPSLPNESSCLSLPPTFKLEEHLYSALEDSAANGRTCDFAEVSRKRRTAIVTAAKRRVVQYVVRFDAKVDVVFFANGEYARNLGIVLEVNGISEGVPSNGSLGSGHQVQGEGRLIQVRPVRINRTGMVRFDLGVVIYRDTRYQVGTVAAIAGEGFVLVLRDIERRAAYQASHRSKLPVVDEIASDAVDRELALEDKEDVEVVTNIRAAGAIVLAGIVGVRVLTAADIALGVGVVQALGPGVVRIQIEC